MLVSMAADRVRLLDLAAQIRNLKQSLSAMRAEQAEAQERLDNYKYPVLTLPNEITSEIFVHFLPIFPDAPPLTGLASPTTLTHVCHKWRAIALTTPALWRAIRLCYKDRMRGYQLQRIADTWISRSGSCPLSIEIDLGGYDFLPPLFTETMAIAVTRSEHLGLCDVTPHPHPKIGPMPFLRSLDLMFEPNDEVHTYDAPQLRSVLLQGFSAPCVVLPWAQLTWLNLNRIEIKPCISILRQTPSLVQCTPHFTCLGDETFEFPGSDLTLLFLEFLTMEASLQAVNRYLCSFVVPALKQLVVEQKFLGQEPIQSVGTFIAKSGCKLLAVCIRGTGTGITENSRLRRAFPTIPIFDLLGVCDGTIYSTDESEAESSSSETESSSSETESAH
ncbi:hypothetical protein C8R45DRAFT_578346 [Mycena sanguinolenta]|nr:hypothetical protein C8R45DRAFT_578346 [Mycena sanguinolenta]